MRAGQLRHRMNILRSVSSQDSYGSPVVSWSTDKEVWASIQALRGHEYFEARRIQSDVSYRVKIRYTTLEASTAIGPTCRLEMVESARKFNIHTVINVDERNIYLELMCSESS